VRHAGDLRAVADLSRGPITPECAPMTTKSPSSAEPATPLWATITQWRPMMTLWADSARGESIFVPSPMTVSDSAPLSTVEIGADLRRRHR
jgi:hypothetical protein